LSVQELLQKMGPDVGAVDVAAFLEHPDTEEAHLLAALRRRDLAASAIEALARSERWGSRHVVRAAVVNHPKTPRTLALRLVPMLFWKELMRTTSNFRISMPIRVAAEKTLAERLPKLELGERVSLARAAPPMVMKRLLDEAHPKVVKALLSNPKLKEFEVIRLAENPGLSSNTLRAIAESDRWSVRHPIKVGLIKNPRTPIHVSLRLLASLPRRKIAQLASTPDLPKVVVVGARRILAE
jgi:hypothetical protein